MEFISNIFFAIGLNEELQQAVVRNKKTIEITEVHGGFSPWRSVNLSGFLYLFSRGTQNGNQKEGLVSTNVNPLTLKSPGHRKQTLVFRDLNIYFSALYLIAIYIFKHAV